MFDDTASNAEFLARAVENAGHPFARGCEFAGIDPGIREAARWRRGTGAALRAAWKRWPKSKNLPKLRETA